jgi:hypothetical protein
LKRRRTRKRRSKRKGASPLDVLKEEVEDSILDRLEDIDRKFSDLF